MYQRNIKTVTLAGVLLLAGSVFGAALTKSSRNIGEQVGDEISPAVHAQRGDGWFFEDFAGSPSDFNQCWEFAGFWANGQVRNRTSHYFVVSSTNATLLGSVAERAIGVGGEMHKKAKRNCQSM